MLSRWNTLLDLISSGSDKHFVTVDGESLDIASVVAVARYGALASVGEGVFQRMEKSFGFMGSCLANGHTIYGVNTGFGGSANTHTDSVERLQRNLISFLNCGMLATPLEDGLDMRNGQAKNERAAAYRSLSKFSRALANEDPVASSTLPESWARATILVRCNSLSSGNSAVRPKLVSSLISLLNENVTPVIPLRGSISASGDLIPLSYIASVLQGSSEAEVWINNAKGTLRRRRITADKAVAKKSLEPLKLAPKEGLALVNGTAVSAGVGSLALHDAHGLTVLSQILTAMSVEALRGTVESFDPFFSDIRSHAGQKEVSNNIRNFLEGSMLVTNKAEDYANSDSLRQDRYSMRTAPQWLGPQLEELVLADKQMSVELNSTTDNPVINLEQEEVLHGGNFQAMSVTLAMEKTRAVLHSIGRLIFAQTTELMNPAFNNGLPPNLTADEPSHSFLFKGIDISVASLQAELGLLSTPVLPHVQTAEMGNQSVNSLALLSARHTHTALNVMTQMSASALLALCQALDLRAFNDLFLSTLQPEFYKVTGEIFESTVSNLDKLHPGLWLQFKRAYSKTTAVDSFQRFVQIMETLRPTILDHAIPNLKDNASLLSALEQWTERFPTLASSIFLSVRRSYSSNPNASQFLGAASQKMYDFVRFQLGVPFLISTYNDSSEQSTKSAQNASLGAMVSRIHHAIQNGALFVPVMECLREAQNVSEM